MHKTKLKSGYIQEIDSLRAIAVLGVILFHLFPQIFTGGFIGVDVFFVISGFVISKTYLVGLLDKKVTFKTFWLKRIRRLMPVYFIVVMLTSIFVFFILEPHLLKSYGKSLIAQPFYVQNFIFWFEGSYFNRAITKPLLHTWSLGVEEQFYLFFAAVILFSQGKIKKFSAVITIIALLSLFIAYVVAQVSPKTSFYLLPMRIWEFYLGFLCYIIADKYRTYNKQLWNYFTYVLLTVLLSTFILFDENSVFPGWHSIVACIVIFLLIGIIIRQPQNFNIILGNRLLQFIGKISYSLYLWHWVVLSLLVNWLDRKIYTSEAIIVMVVVLILSYLTLIIIENPIRNRELLGSNSSLVRYMLVNSLIIIIIGGFFVQTHGASFRYDEPHKTWLETAQQKSPYRCGLIKRITNFTSEICAINQVKNSNKPGVLIIGDSHADQLDEMIAKLGKQYGVPVYLTVRNCKFDYFYKTNHCNKNVFNKILQEIMDKEIRTVIAVSYWGDTGLKYENFDKPTNILNQRGIKIIFSEVVPHTKMFNPVERTKADKRLEVIEKYQVKEYNTSVKLQRKIFSLLKDKYTDNIKIVSPGDYFCIDSTCEYADGKYPYYIDNNHLSYDGVSKLKPMYEEIFIPY